jgi:hypothetical protein
MSLSNKSEKGHNSIEWLSPQSEVEAGAWGEPMAFNLPLPRQLAKVGWKVKIRDKERLEEPHITIIKGTACWRLGLRSRMFLDEGCNWKDLPGQLRSVIEDKDNWERLSQAWDAEYPNNLIAGEEGDDDDDD